MAKTGIFPGSFNPFTIGHKAIVEEALKVFDKVIIVFSINTQKDDNYFDVAERVNVVRKIFSKHPEVEVIYTNKMTMDVANEYNAMIIRGLRDTKDFEYEKNISNVNRHYGNVSTVFFLLGPEYDTVSSSVVRELQKYGKTEEAEKLIAK